MSRVDVPMYMCDRCKIKTSDNVEIKKFKRLSYVHVRPDECLDWDLCKYCWEDLNNFINDTPTMRG
jgi:hypothetical protein